MTMITPSYLGETIEYSSLHACRSTLEDPTQAQIGRAGETGDRFRRTRQGHHFERRSIYVRQRTAYHRNRIRECGDAAKRGIPSRVIDRTRTTSGTQKLSERSRLVRSAPPSAFAIYRDESPARRRLGRRAGSIV